jgi:ankyrin repeat protein
LAVFFRQPQTARLLLDAGANPSNRARNALGVGPVHAAVAR